MTAFDWAISGFLFGCFVGRFVTLELERQKRVLLPKPGAALALTLLAADLEALEAWLIDRVDYDYDGDPPSAIGNDESRHADTVIRVRAELARIAKAVE
mgnify:CR=1 FL=1